MLLRMSSAGGAWVMAPSGGIGRLRRTSVSAPSRMIFVALQLQVRHHVQARRSRRTLLFFQKLQPKFVNVMDRHQQEQFGMPIHVGDNRLLNLELFASTPEGWIAYRLLSATIQPCRGAGCSMEPLQIKLHPPLIRRLS